ncbi:hypothetical protein F7725_003544 [Dissostichus mawsoni]|uniref:Arf-GAP domain-containing protein n=1 Tax=Dissostichus mawsoni TaxID=36200 RepID=A0A7J5YAH6_DISMA|nr:hypothetical protein F7725_003544 [Dissostichus mawsoni]
MANHERNKNILLELIKLPDNSRCADCGAPDPDWASDTLGVFVCLNCSGIHRSLSCRVKSIKLDYWDDKMVEVLSPCLSFQMIDPIRYSFFRCVFFIKFMKSNGNAKNELCTRKLFHHTTIGPRKVTVVLKEQWIRAKYERMEFTGETKYPPLSYTTGFYEGMLWKKGKENTQFLKRKFVLSEREFTLTYYNKENESKGPKALISIKDINATFQPEKIGHPNGLQITYQDDDHTRNLYVYHESPQVGLLNHPKPK